MRPVKLSIWTSGGSVGTVSSLVFDSATGTGSFDVTFSDGPATSTVSVQVQDSDGASSNVSSIDVAVGNVAPTVTLSGPGSASARVLWGTGRGSFLRAGMATCVAPAPSGSIPSLPGPYRLYLPLVARACR